MALRIGGTTPPGRSRFWAPELHGGHLQGLLQEHSRLPLLPVLSHHAGIADPPDRAFVRLDPFQLWMLHYRSFSETGCHGLG